MKKLEMNQMSTLQGGGGCFAAMANYGASMGALHSATTTAATITAIAGIAGAFATMVKACEE